MMIKYVQDKSIDTDLVEKYLSESRKHNQWTNGGPVKSMLEEKLAKMVMLPSDGSKRLVCVANGTNALHALMFCYEKRLKRKLKWVTPAYTFPSCIVNGLNTKILDISPHTYTLSPKDLEGFDGAIITNLFGTVVPFDETKVKDKIIIYDNASSFMTRTQFEHKNISLLGNATFSSLHHTKTLGFGEGGFVVIDADMYDDFVAACCFGFYFDRTPHKLSSNFKMSDISAAYILQHIERYDLSKHFMAQHTYREELHKISGAKIFNNHPFTFLGNLPILFDKPTSTELFRNVGIEANKYYKPLKKLKNSMWLYDRMVNFPLNADTSHYDIETICEAIRRFAK